MESAFFFPQAFLHPQTKKSRRHSGLSGKSPSFPFLSPFLFPFMPTPVGDNSYFLGRKLFHFMYTNSLFFWDLIEELIRLSPISSL